MPTKTPTYKMTYFERGALYSARSDMRRFVTLDYNLESYIGIVGDGIIEGWEIEENTGLSVKIMPGHGIINGVGVESPYIYKQRSEMSIPEIEIEIVETDMDASPYPNLTAEEKEKYIEVIKGYNPDAEFESEIENKFVKVVIPTIFTLLNNVDNYIYAVKTYNNPYPELYDYPSPLGEEPSTLNYDNYDNYLIALNEYNLLKSNVDNYAWRNNTSNHFTNVGFVKHPNLTSIPNSLLLGVVKVRSGAIQSIKLNDSKNLKNLKGIIEQETYRSLENHKHGGSGDFDPPKITLNSDFRSLIFAGYRSDGFHKYLMLSPDLTYSTDDHQHSYHVNQAGDGNTFEVYGKDSNHFHRIVKFKVEESAGDIASHTHELKSVLPYNITIERFVIYNSSNEIIGDNDSIQYSASSNIFYLDLPMPDWQEYTTTFEVEVLVGMTTTEFIKKLEEKKKTGKSFEFSTEPVTYTFSSRNPTILSFMLRMQSDFYSKYHDLLIPAKEVVDVAILTGSVGGTNVFSRSESDAYIEEGGNPFEFSSDSGLGFAGLEDLISQCQIADNQLKAVGDYFLFVPKAAKNILVQLTSDPIIRDSYNIEILGKAEVFGKLRTKNIAYVNANKFKLGKFEIERIPFISHDGFFNKQAYGVESNLSSPNGFEYFSLPRFTNTVMGHSHMVDVNSLLYGDTIETIQGGDPVYYSTGEESELIYHTHNITKGALNEIESIGINNIEGNEPNTKHTHEMLFPEKNYPNAVYSIEEDKEGNLLIGSSNGLYIKPLNSAISFWINSKNITVINKSLEDSIIEAKYLYEKEYQKNITFDYDHLLIDEIENSLINHDDFYYINPSSDRFYGNDEILIQKKSYFLSQNFNSYEDKVESELGADDIILDIYFRVNGSNELIPEINEDAILADSNASLGFFQNLEVIYKTKKSLKNRTINNIFTFEIENETKYLILNSKNILIGSNIYDPFDGKWEKIKSTDGISFIHKFFVDSKNNLFVLSNNKVYIGNVNSALNSLSEISLNASYGNINDGLEYGDYYYFNSGSKLYRYDLLNNESIDIKTFAENIKQIININGKINVLLDNGEINYSSEPAGQWTILSQIPFQDFGKIYEFNNHIYIPNVEGLWFFDGSWHKIIDSPLFSFSTSQDEGTMYCGGNNAIYAIDKQNNFSEILNIRGGPLPYIVKNDRINYFDYDYNNFSNSFIYRSPQYLSQDDYIYAYVDFSKWDTSYGPWMGKDIEVSINNYLIYSSLKNIDKRGDKYNFSISSEEGQLNFGASTTIEESILPYESVILVQSSEEFKAGDIIAIKSQIEKLDLPENPIEAIKKNLEQQEDKIILGLYDFSPDIASIKNYKTEAINVSEKNDEINNMFILCEISNVIGKFIYLKTKIPYAIEAPATVFRIPSISSFDKVEVSIFDSKIFNVGDKTHKEVEDHLTSFDSGLPYKFNNTYLSNLSQLSQAVRYVYPDVNSNFKNSMFYDFHYGINSNVYPDSRDFIDYDLTKLNSNIIYKNKFTKAIFGNINAVVLGSGKYLDYLFVGTDMGLFASKYLNSIEGNWFSINDDIKNINDIIIVGEEILLASNTGIYYSSDLLKWNVASLSIDKKINAIDFRWAYKPPYIEIQSHNAIFSNDDYNFPETGRIKIYQDLYEDIRPNKSLLITGSNNEEVDGVYYVLSVTPREIIIDKGFSNLTSEKTYNVSFAGYDWWSSFAGEAYLGNGDLNNIILAGGASSIFYNPISNSSGSFSKAIFEEEISGNIQKYEVNDFLNLNSGNAYAFVDGFNKDNKKISYIAETENSGSYWRAKEGLEGAYGIISKCSLSNRNSILNVAFIDNFKDKNKVELKFQANSLINSEISIYVGDENITSSFYVVKNKDNNIETFGQEIYNLFIESGNNDVYFYINPTKIYNGIELQDKSILMGTNNGIWIYDNDLSQYKGTINRLGKKGILTSIDFKGLIKSTQKAISGNIQLSIQTENNIKENSLIGNNIYININNFIETYTVLKNSSRSLNNEVIVEIEKPFIENFSKLNGLKVILQKSNSIFKVNFDQIVDNGEFEGGEIIFYDKLSDEYISHKITNQSGDLITIEKALDFKSNTDVPNENQEFILFNENISLYVDFENPVKENQFNDKVLSIRGFDYNIVYNSEFEIILKKDNSESQKKQTEESVVNLIDGGEFEINGSNIYQLFDFNIGKLSENSDHTHDVDLVGKVINGEILTIDTSNEIILNTNVTSIWDSKLDIDASLLNGEVVTIYNPLDRTQYYKLNIKKLYKNKIILSEINKNIFSSSYNLAKISPTWKFSIDASFYGYTINTYYNNFTVSVKKVIQNINMNDSFIMLENVNDLSIGDKIKIESSQSTSSIYYIENIVDAKTIELSQGVPFNFYLKDTPILKVLSDVYSNNHIHAIKNNEVSSIEVNEYNDAGYPYYHSHRLIPYIEEVYGAIKHQDSILVYGNEAIIYSGSLDLSEWIDLFDINDTNPLNNEKSIINCDNTGENPIFASGNSFLYTKTFSNTILPLTPPSI